MFRDPENKGWSNRKGEYRRQANGYLERLQGSSGAVLTSCQTMAKFSIWSKRKFLLNTNASLKIIDTSDVIRFRSQNVPKYTT